MSTFITSQVLVALATIFDLASFQFKEKKKIVACLFCGAVLIAAHFALLEQWTAASLIMVAPIRYGLSFYTSSAIFKYILCLASMLIAFFTYSGFISIISCCGSVIHTIAAFSKNDRRLRELMAVGIGFWILHNYLAGSPMAVIVEVIFLSSNLVGYYRHYYKNRVSAKT